MPAEGTKSLGVMQMVKCENCGKQVDRRVTWRDGKKVCKECAKKLSYSEYYKWCELILDNRKR